MTPSIDDHATRFDQMASEYDEHESPEYETALGHVVAAAAPTAADVVLDLGTGTGAVALSLAPQAGTVLGRDISEGMLEEAERKAAEAGFTSVHFAVGRFREPNVPADTDVDIVTSNFALHHLADEEKRTAIATIADLDPRRIVIGDVMFFGEPDPDEPFYSPEVDNPATVGTLAEALTAAGYALTAVERIHDQVGVLVAERFDQGSLATGGTSAESERSEEDAA